MKIGLIMHPYGEKESAGLGKAIFSIVKAIIESNSSHEYIIFLKGSHTPDPDIKGDKWKVYRMPTHLFWLDQGLQLAPQQDVYIFFTPFMPLLPLSGRKIVVAHDFAYKYIPAETLTQRLRQCILYFVHKSSLKSADTIVAISNYTKEEIVHHFRIEPSKIAVIYNGFTPVCRTPRSQAVSGHPFFLFTGVIKPRKNVQILIEAYILANEMYKEEGFPSLILVGKDNGAYSSRLKTLVLEHTLQHKIIFKGYVKDGELDSLYQGSLALIFPSLIEGFGLPILEAMHCGVPVITSNQGAMKEIAGEAAFFVDPNDSVSIANGMRTIFEHPELRQVLVEKGSLREKMFSWENAAKRYHEIIKTYEG
jgi:glycosyltransferase involved in cell wall biosynthesis